MRRLTTRAARTPRSPARADADARVGGIVVTHPDRIMYPADEVTKVEMVRYYDTVADAMLLHLRGRPLTLKQCAPDADHCRYLRHSGGKTPPPGVRVVQIQELKKRGDYMIVDTRAALLTLSQRNIVEFHTWNARFATLERPDRIVLDLDPGPALAWRDVVTAARLVRRMLDSLRLRSWIKTTGGRGLHIVVPIRPTPWETCLTFARTLAQQLASHDPTRYTTRFAKAGRERQVLIDYLRNNRTNTSIAAYSARARATPTVSVPLDWDDLSPRLNPAKWTIRTVPRRLASHPDPWADLWRAHQRLPKLTEPELET